jgi:hypothetical protein
MSNKLNLHVNQVISIIEKFDTKFTYKLCPGRKKDLTSIKEEDIIYINSYIKECKYAEVEKKIENKLHLIIKYKFKNDISHGVYSLNILLDNYKNIIDL